MFFISALLYFSVLSTATPAKRALNCREFVIPVDVSALGHLFSHNLTAKLLNDNYTAFFELAGTAPQQIIATGYNISARYCEPAVVNASRSNTLQFLVHGSTYTKSYWSGLAAPGMLPANLNQDLYSWILYASNQGYPTLSIDRPCNGNSSRPNGLLNCLLSTQTEVMHAIVQMARSGSLPTVPTVFKKVIYVGHSYGSFIGNDLAVRHPTDVDSYVLSGYTLNFSVATFALLGAAPAFIAVPDRYGFLAPDASYLVATNEPGVRQAFYFGNFDPAFFQYDYDNRGTSPVSETAQVTFLGQRPAPSYTGSLFVVNGNQDLLFCSKNNVNALLSVTPNCDSGFTAQVQNNYVAVRRFGFHNTNQTGHDVNLHRTAQESYKASFDFLALDGF